MPTLFPINYQSDGLFSAGAQRLKEDINDFNYDGNQKRNSHVVNLPADGANHAELLNHPSVTTWFYNIFIGNTPASNFFKNHINTNPHLKP